MIVMAAVEAAASGLSWPQVIGGIGIGTAVGSIVSAMITGGFLRAQSKRQDAREDRRLRVEREQRETDRKAEVDRRRAERQHALDDY